MDTFRTLSLSRHKLGYAHNPLDRMANLRDDANAIPALHRDGTARVLAFAGERVLMRSRSEGPWFSVSEAARFGDPRATVFLGRSENEGIFAYRFDSPAEGSEGAPPTDDLRTMATAGAVPPAELGMLAQAKALFHWHFSHRFCAN
ncbi:MAG: NADH pyrophosphatase, partial [Methylobacterium mesophilicum]|nr:NADH pyrophosphatase [Methylobacterium mesophilicum]